MVLGVVRFGWTMWFVLDLRQVSCSVHIPGGGCITVVIVRTLASDAQVSGNDHHYIITFNSLSHDLQLVM